MRRTAKRGDLTVGMRVRLTAEGVIESISPSKTNIELDQGTIGVGNFWFGEAGFERYTIEILDEPQPPVGTIYRFESKLSSGWFIRTAEGDSGWSFIDDRVKVLRKNQFSWDYVRRNDNIKRQV